MEKKYRLMIKRPKKSKETKSQSISDYSWPQSIDFTGEQLPEASKVEVGDEIEIQLKVKKVSERLVDEQKKFTFEIVAAKSL